jgi:Flp pilus assembly pilin Flp
VPSQEQACWEGTYLFSPSAIGNHSLGLVSHVNSGCKNMRLRLLYDEEATTFAEYGLLLAIIALAAVGGALLLGEGLSTLFQRCEDTLTEIF